MITQVPRSFLLVIKSIAHHHAITTQMTCLKCVPFMERFPSFIIRLLDSFQRIFHNVEMGRHRYLRHLSSRSRPNLLFLHSLDDNPVGSEGRSRSNRDKPTPTEPLRGSSNSTVHIRREVKQPASVHYHIVLAANYSSSSGFVMVCNAPSSSSPSHFEVSIYSFGRPLYIKFRITAILFLEGR